MKKIIILICIVIASITMLLIANYLASRNAIHRAKSFCARAGIHLKQEPYVQITMPTQLADYFVLTKVVRLVSDNGDEESYSSYINNDKSFSYYNHTVIAKVSRNNNLSTSSTNNTIQPEFLPESKAKQVIFNIAKKVGVSDDFEFTGMHLNNKQAVWYGNWTRKYLGFDYEYDSIIIQIMAFSGELYSIIDTSIGTPCPIEIKVTKEEAITKGWLKISKYFDEDKWKKLKNEYEVKTAKLKIVQPNVFLGFVIPIWKSNESRLAWVVEYAPIKESDANKRLEIGYHDRFVIKIDASTKVFLGGITGIHK